jgi:sulfate adenylyltransferase subunit 1 (EFTu-like GTPase family)
MDLVDWDRSAYQRIADDMESLAHRLGLASCTVIPISALHGDNVVDRSDAAPWYDGPTVLDALESARAGGWAAQHGAHRGSGARLPVQWVLRQPGGGRAYAGMVNGGAFRAGDPVVVLPQGARTTVRAIETADGPLQRADVGLSVSLRLADNLDVSRGDLIAAAEEAPAVTDTFEATVCWFHDRPLVAGDRLRLKHTTRVTPVLVESVSGTFDVNELSVNEATELRENEIGVVTLRTATPLAVDPYESDRITGSFVLIDDSTIATIAAGMVGPPRLHG